MIEAINNKLSIKLKQISLIANWKTNWEFKVERELLKGCHQAKSSHQSIIHFSINKAATQYVKSILRRCALENDMAHARMNEYAFKSNLPYLDHLSWQEMQKYQHIFKPRGYLYSVFGGMVEGIPNLNDYYVVLMVRDPRDILTSKYFSIGYSHRLPTGENKIESFMQRRAFAQQVEIDEYVISQSDRILQQYQRYLDLLLNQANVHIIKYEDMISNFSVWLDNLLNYCDLKISAELKQQLIQESLKSRPKKENILNHIRQVTPGDHKRKLQPETIAQLNSSFSTILREFKYI